MKKLLLLGLFAVFSCSSEDDGNENKNGSLSFTVIDYYTINDGIREDYSFSSSGVIKFTADKVTVNAEGKTDVLFVKNIDSNIYSVWKDVIIDNGDGSPVQTVTRNLTYEILSNKVLVKDDDNPSNHPSYYEIHYLIN